jgi:hypothetical protein
MAMTLITTNTHTGDSDATSDFTSGIDSTYKLFIFKFFDINPATDLAEFTFNGSIDAGSNYNVTKTTTFFRAYHTEADSAELAYDTANDLAQSTAFQNLSMDVGNGADESCAGTLWLFNPSSTTYVKHFYCTNSTYDGADAAYNYMIGGYFNNTDNIDAVQFKMSAGNFDGTIAMYGVG